MRWRRGWRAYAVIFVVSAIWEAMLSFDTVFTSHFSILPVGVTSLLNVVLSYGMFERIVENAKVNQKKMWTFAIGAAVGAMVGVALLERIYQ
jgi:uncharacterized membrane protein YfcA